MDVTRETPRHPCSICKAEVPPRGDNPSWPFCSDRCRTIDLGNWLGETYRVPAEEVEVPDEVDEDPETDRSS